MSRMNRIEHGKQMLARQRPQQPKRFSQNEINAFVRRLFKRQMIAKGLLTITEKPPKFVWGFSYEGEHSSVAANTRSEARAKIKKYLGLKRLPPHFDLEKIGDN